jgi:hypothetical protein
MDQIRTREFVDGPVGVEAERCRVRGDQLARRRLTGVEEVTQHRAMQRSHFGCECGVAADCAPGAPLLERQRIPRRSRSRQCVAELLHRRDRNSGAGVVAIHPARQAGNRAGLGERVDTVDEQCR